MSSKTRTSFAADRPDEIEMDLRICLPLGEWKKIKVALEVSGQHTHHGPLGIVCNAITSMVRQAERAWTPEGPEATP